MDDRGVFARVARARFTIPILALIAFTAVTVIGWVAFGERSAIAYIDKIIELALIVLLWMDARRS